MLLLLLAWAPCPACCILAPLPCSHLPARLHETLCRFGGPIWWNTPLDGEEGTAAENRTMWGQEGAGGEPGSSGGGAGLGPSAAGGQGAAVMVGGKRGVQEVYAGAGEDEEDDMPEEVKKRLAALKG